MKTSTIKQNTKSVYKLVTKVIRGHKWHVYEHVSGPVLKAKEINSLPRRIK